ncbi:MULTISPECIES: DsrE/DsrF/DrsH-like family protein [Acidianus]|uniref:Peroxiredoxin n=2 Tax=Acidianus TaxID=12914 RepID=A0A650CTQ9_ACIAM|nr:DsrE/DsrF/DrsH-like family protein [Acidianus ambivalens]MQL56277.1 peroxiredoxin [Acidianus ambivalens]PVU75731.1 peroxiredoxin [Acidianus hospitalis]QGR21188.1 peroxiredoxin [Acidianus ambivalens]
MGSKKLSLIVFSGTIDKLMPVGILASGAAAAGYEVNLFFTFWGLQAITKKSIGQPQPIDKNYEQFGPVMMQRMQEMKYPTWDQLIMQAKEVGEVKVYACSTTMEFFGLKREDLADFVDDVVGVATFLDRAEGGTTLFI